MKNVAMATERIRRAERKPVRNITVRVAKERNSERKKQW